MVLLTACGPARPPDSFVPPPREAEVESSVFLVGDAGATTPTDPLLVDLRDRLAAAAAGVPTAVAFLGDNVYPRGLRSPSHPSRARDEARLRALVDAVRETGARALFVPGNHDWSAGRETGLAAVRRQDEYVARHGGPRVRMLPAGGCPGPESVDVGERLRVVLLDTQWWIHRYARGDSSSGCDPGTEEAVVDSLTALLGNPEERHVLVLGHHPLRTGGRHGGYVSVREHVFPLTIFRPWLLVPLPGPRAVYGLYAGLLEDDQDLGGPRYQAFVDAVEGALAEHPPLAYAAGHDHNLQVIRDPDVGMHLVSGSASKLSPLRTAVGGLYRKAVRGYMRIDVLRDGRVRLGVLALQDGGRVQEVFSMWMVEEVSPRSAGPPTDPPDSPAAPGPT